MKSLKLNNKRGLLAVVMALAMVFAGAVFVADEADATDSDVLEISTSEELLEAIEGQNEEGAPSKWVLTGAEYDLSSIIETGMVITQDGLTIEGLSATAKALIYGGCASVVDQYETITISADNVTLKNLSIMANIAYYTTQYQNGLAIYQTAGVAKTTIENVDVLKNTKADTSEMIGGVKVSSIAGGIYLGGVDAQVKDASSYGGYITVYNAEVTYDNVTVYVANISKVMNDHVNEDGRGVTFVLETDRSTTNLINIECTQFVGFTVKLNGNDLTVPKDSTLTATVEATDGSEAVFAGLTSSVGDITISEGSIVVGSNDVEINGDTITVKSGTFKLNESTGVSLGITIDEGATLIVPKGVEVEGNVANSGTIELSGILSGTNNSNAQDAIIQMNDASAMVVLSQNDGVVSVNVELASGNQSSVGEGTIALAPGITKPTGMESTDIVSNTQYTDSFGMSKDLESDYTVKTSAFLEKDLTIPEGVTLTVAGVLDLNGVDLNVKGTLVVEKKGSIVGYVGTAGDKGIVLSQTGTIVNEGTIGADSVVKVTDGTNYVQMKNVKGLSFGLTKEVPGGKVTYTLTVSGEVSKTGAGYDLTIVGAYITDLEIKDLAKIEKANPAGGYDYYATIGGTVLKNGTLTIGSKAAVNNMTVALMNGATISIDGEVAGGSSVWMQNGASAVIDGSADNVAFSAKAGKYLTYSESDGSKNNPETIITSTSTITVVGLKGVTIDVTSKTYTNSDDKSETEQMLNLGGAPEFILKGDNASGQIGITNGVYIPAGTEIALADDMTFTGTGTPLVTVDGVLSMTEETLDFYKGANYVVKVPKETAGNHTVNYYTTFDNAYANIATAEDMEITLMGGYTFKKEYTVAADQTINLSDDAAETYKISKDGKVTVEADGAITPVSGVFDDIKGLLIVMDGASCKPSPGSYEVSSKDADGNMTYTSAQNAIANAQPGETIYITGAVEFDENATIPEGVTVDVASTASIDADKDLVVAGKLVNNGLVDIAGDLDVTGEVDNDGTVTMSGNAKEITVTGTFAGNVSLGTAKVNAAQFTNDDGENTYTNVAAALAAVAEMDVPVDVKLVGEFSEASDVALVEGMKLVIDGDITLGSIRLVAGSQLIVNADKTLTADVVASVGTEETTGALSDATVSVSKFKGTATTGSTWTVVYDASKVTYTMRMPDYTDGAVVIETGSVDYTAAGTVAFTSGTTGKTLKVGSGATLVVVNNVVVSDTGTTKSFVNEGTVQSKAGMEFVGATIGGDIVVDAGMTLALKGQYIESDSASAAPVTIVGTVTLSEKDGSSAKVQISGQVLLGSKPKTLGATGSIIGDVVFDAAGVSPETEAGYIIVFDGSTFQNTDDSKETLSTQYSVNGIEFATVYTTQAVATTVVNKIVAGLKDLDVPDVMTDTEKTDYEAIPSTYVRDYANDITWYSGSSKATTVGQYASVSSTISYKNVSFIVSVGPGLMVYLDDIQNTTGSASLAIGTHTVTVYVDKGYEGTPVITFNGTTVTDGKLVLTSDMLGEENKLVVTGATVVQDQPVVIQSSETEDEGMALTDILLIVLVVLIIIMAVIVALRMMRS